MILEGHAVQGVDIFHDPYQGIDSSSESDSYDDSVATSQLPTDSPAHSHTDSFEEEVYWEQPTNRLGRYSQRGPEGHIGKPPRISSTEHVSQKASPHGRDSTDLPYPTICLSCYSRNLQYMPKCLHDRCINTMHTAKGRLKIIQNYEKLTLHEKGKLAPVPYMRAKKILNEQTYNKTGPLEDAL